MGITQTQSATEQLEPQVLLPNNPFVPPKGGICLIKKLPPELLSHTFEFGFADDGIEDEEDIADSYNHLDATMAHEKDIHDRDVEMKQDEVEGGEEDEGDEGASDETETHLPFTLAVSHVCRHWRNVALSTPSFWTTIVVPPEARSPKSLPIDITVSYGDLDEYEDDYEPPSEADLDILFAMLIPHIHRWRTIRVTASECHH
ncbi:hypothetical protein L210DRAFT_3557697, partial [Boletus edulis BED1]